MTMLLRQSNNAKRRSSVPIISPIFRIQIISIVMMIIYIIQYCMMLIVVVEGYVVSSSSSLSSSRRGGIATTDIIHQRRYTTFRSERRILRQVNTFDRTIPSNYYNIATLRSSSSIDIESSEENIAVPSNDDVILEDDDDNTNNDNDIVDVAIIGAGLGGLCAGAILSCVYGKKVGIYESHYLAGGCAHAFPYKSKTSKEEFIFDSGPTILLGCSSPPYNALRQVLDVINQPVEWIPYDGWGMIERNASTNELLRWKVPLGLNVFENGPLQQFGGELAVQEFRILQEKTRILLAGSSIPAMAMRPGPTAIIPLVLNHFSTLLELIPNAELSTGTFGPFMDGPINTVTSSWLRNWLDALAFSLSGLPANRTLAAAMAFVLYDMHRPGAALDYPKGGMGSIVNALVQGITKSGSNVYLRHTVESITCNDDASKINGLIVRKRGKTKQVTARLGVVCNAPVWSLNNLIKDERIRQKLCNNNVALATILSQSSTTTRNTKYRPPMSWKTTTEGSSIALVREFHNNKNKNNENNDNTKTTSKSLLELCQTAEMTGSFLHLHIAINATGINLNDMEAHYTYMDRSLTGDENIIVNNVRDGPCGELNMIAVSNPCKLDTSLAPPGYIIIHAYGAGNEPYDRWENINRNTIEYRNLKEQRAQVLWRAIESIIPDVKERIVLQLIGSPLTHERFLRRPAGTYGSATEDYFKDGSTPYGSSFVIANDGIFPGIGVPAVAIAGTSAANNFINLYQHWRTLNKLQK